jgi:hypothetical protein
MRGVHGTYGEDDGKTVLQWGNLWERDHLEDTGTRWEDNIRTDLQEIGWEGMEWISLQIGTGCESL